MKGREIRETLQGKVDPAVIHVLAEMSESMSAQKEEVMVLAEMQNKCVDLIMQLGVTIEGATSAVDEIHKIRRGDPE